MKNIKNHGKVKHIDIQHYYIHDLLQPGDIQIEQVPSINNLNLTDLFTKPLPHNHHHWLLESLNIH